MVEAPKLPRLPSIRKLKHFLICAVWAGLMGLGTGAVYVGDSLIRFSEYNEPVDWGQARDLSGFGFIAGIWGYWQKYKAWLLPPPE